MIGHDIIVIGASMGGVEALTNLVGQLPDDLPAAIFVVQHTAAHGPGYLAEILNRSGPLTVKMAEDREAIHPGMVYIAPPDYHLLLKPGHLRVAYGPRENRTRPAIDPLFRSAAVAYSHRVVGLILTGYLDDGTAGLRAIKRCGGVALVQDPEDAAYPDMPQSALTYVEVDCKLPLADIGRKLIDLTQEPAGEAPPIPEDIALEVKIAERVMSDIKLENRLGELAPVTCPECHGALWKIENDSIPRYRCHLGHAYTAQNLLEGQSQAVEEALWVALRTLEERINMLMTLARNEDQRSHISSSQRFEDEAKEVRKHAETIKGLLFKGELATTLTTAYSDLSK